MKLYKDGVDWNVEEGSDFCKMLLEAGYEEFQEAEIIEEKPKKKTTKKEGK